MNARRFFTQLCAPISNLLVFCLFSFTPIIFAIGPNAGTTSSGSTSTYDTNSQPSTVTSTLVLPDSPTGLDPSLVSGNCAALPSGLVSWWPAEGNANDVFGTNNGTLYGGATIVPGIVGQAFNFDGSGQKVTIPDNDSLKLTNSLTIEAWIYARGSGFLLFRGDTRPGLDPYSLTVENSGMLQILFTDATNNALILDSPSPLPTSQWEHVAATLDGASGNVKLYINGAVVAQTNTSIRPFRDLDPNYGPGVGIGGHSGTYGYFPFNGMIDEMSLYSRALSQAEIQSIYNAGSAGKCLRTAPGVPVITSVSPGSGAVGAAITISGANFSPIAASNTVYFGAARAFVTAANASSLTVIVPSGAIYAPITATISNLTAYAPAPFMPTFSGTNELDSSSLAPRVDIPSGSGPYRVKIGDLDGDGKPDLVTIHAYSADVWIWRNISTNGLLSAASFAPPVILPVGGGRDSLLGLALADLDGDGRLDIVVANGVSNNVTIFQNLALPGSITSNSFAARLDFPVGALPIDLAVRDLDGDGKPDIVTANYNDSTVSVLQNTSSGGLLSSSSFAAKVDFATASGTHGVALADLDGDGRPDIVVANNSGNSDTVSILRNVGSPGALTSASFASHIDFAGGGEMVVVGDLDGDGKPDLAVGSWQKQVLSVFRNTGIGSGIDSNSFAARVDFATGGNVHHLALGDLDGDGRPDIAVVTELPSQLSLFKNTAIPGSFTSGSLGGRVDFSSGWNADGVAIGDLDGDGRPDIVFGNAYDNMISVYRNITPLTFGPACVPAPAGLVSWWPGQGHALDVAGGNNGTLVGNTTYGPGFVGEGFVLDGSTDAVVVGNRPNLQLQDFSIEAWIRRADPNVVSYGSHGDALIFSYGSGGYGLGLLNDGQLFLSRIDIDNVTISSGVADTNFHHVVVTKSGTTVVFYLDGVAHPAPSYGSTFSFSSVAAIGARADTMDDSFLGTIDEVSVYNRALTASEVSSIYTAASAGKCRAPIAPFITTQPANRNTYVGDSVTLRVEASGDAPLSYQWFFNSNALAGATSALLSLPSVQLANSGSYSVTISNVAGSVTSSNALVTVNPVPPCDPPPAGIVSWWPGQTNTFDAADGNNGTLAGNATYGPGRVGLGFVFDGSGDAVIVGNPTNLQLQDFSVETWIKRTDPVVATFGTHTTALFFSYGSGGYGFGMWNDGRLFLTKVDVDNVTTGVAITDTDFHHVAVTKSGSTVVFYIDGVAYNVTPYNPGFGFATVAALGARADTMDDSFFGTVDELAVYNRALSAAEVLAIYNADNAGKCIVPVPPSITKQPTNATVAAGSTATFSVVAQGSPPLSYQWYFGSNGIPTGTAATLTLPNVQPNQAGSYSVVVSNAYGIIAGSNATLAVLTFPPNIVTQPKSQTVFQGKTVSFSVTATGTQPLAYQWYFNTNNALVGRTSPGLILVNVQTNQSGNYSVLVTNAYGSATSILASLLVLPPPVCVTAPTGLVSWWRAESNLVDSVGLNDLSLVNQSTFNLFTTGEVGTAFQFVTGWLVTPANGALDLGAGPGLTVEGWIKPNFNPTGFTTLQPILEWNDGRTNIGSGLMINSRTGAGVLEGYLTDTNSFPPRFVVLRSPIQTITTSNWQHVALTFDSASGSAVMYVNGSSVAHTNLGHFVPQTKAPVYLGYRPSGVFLGSHYSGTMDEMSIYSRALTSNELFSIYMADGAGKCPPNPPACVPEPAGIAAWWRGQSNTIDTISGNTGVISGVVTYSNAEVGLGFQFNGGYIRVPAAPSLNIGAGSGLTIELWANPTVYGPQPFAEFNSGTGTQGVYLAYSVSGPMLEANLVDTSGLAHIIRSPVGLITNRVFQHFAVTYDKASGSAALYINGNAVTSTNVGSFTPQTTNALYFGYRPPGPYTGSGLHFTGTMDEMTLYSRALTSDEIRSIVLARGGGKCGPDVLPVAMCHNVVVSAGTNCSAGASIDNGSFDPSGGPVLLSQSPLGPYALGTNNVMLTVTTLHGLSNSCMAQVIVLDRTPPAILCPANIATTNDLNQCGAVVTFRLPGATDQCSTVTNVACNPPPGSFFPVGTNPVQCVATDAAGNTSPPCVFLVTVIDAQAPTIVCPSDMSVTNKHDAWTSVVTYAPAVSDNCPGVVGPICDPVSGTAFGLGVHTVNCSAMDAAGHASQCSFKVTVWPGNVPPVPIIQVTPLSTFPGDTNLIVISANNTNARVTFDGSKSYDLDDTNFYYFWYEGTNLFSTNPITTRVLELGTHQITLWLDDTFPLGTNSATVKVEVLSASDSIGLIFVLLNGASLSPNALQPLEASLNAAAASFARSDFTAGMNQLNAFENKVQAQIAPFNPTLAQELIDAAQTIINALGKPGGGSLLLGLPASN